MNVIFWISFGILWVIVAIQGFAQLEVLRQLGQMHKEHQAGQGNLFIHDAKLADQPLPKVTGHRAIDLLPADWDDFLSKDQGVIILLSTTCITCRSVAEKLQRFWEKAKDSISLVALVEGKPTEIQAFLKETGINQQLVIVDEDGTTAKDLGVKWKPGVVSVRNRAIDQIGIINDADQLDLLLVQGMEPSVTG
jgi:hypothetical protein